MVDQSKLAMWDVNFPWNREEFMHLVSGWPSENEDWKWVKDILSILLLFVKYVSHSTFPEKSTDKRPEIMLIGLSLSAKKSVFSLSQLADNLSFNMIHMCGSWCWLSAELVVPMI